MKKRLKRGKNHGFSRTRLYHIWGSMKSRCYNENLPDYKNYGGRGIRVCEEWRAFLPFREWARANGYAEHLTIDRKDNNGNYEPGNCRWIAKSEQGKNRRGVTVLTLNGETYSVSFWAERLGIPHHTIWQRKAKFGKSDKQALSAERLSPTIFDVDQCTDILRRRKNGQSMESIADDLGCGRMTIFRVVHGVGRYARAN